MRKFVIMLFTVFLFVNTVLPSGIASAESKYVTVDNFADWLVPRIKDVAFDFNDSIEYLLEIGIIKEGEFKSYNSYITRGDALVLLNRADEYLFGDSLTQELVDTVIEKRISDINDIEEYKRNEVAKGYIKGFMKGYSNGPFSTDRNLQLNKKITYNGALFCANMLRDKYERAKVSPDGQLLNTIDAPKFYYKYPYTLANYPDSYYDEQYKYYGPGKYEVDKDIPIGEYAIYSVNSYDVNDPAYFEVNKKSNLAYSGKLKGAGFCPNVVNLKKGTYLYLRDAYAIAMKDADLYRGFEGVFKVGEQIKPGTYTIQRSPYYVSASYVIWSSIESFESMKSNTVQVYNFKCDGIHDTKSVTLKEGQYVQFSGCYIADLFYYGIKDKQISKDIVGIRLYNVQSAVLNNEKIIDIDMDGYYGRVTTGLSKAVPLNYAYNDYIVLVDDGEYTLELKGTDNSKKKITFVIDTKKPTIDGIINKADYYDSVNVRCSDEYGIKEIILNGKTIKNNTTVKAEGNYTLKVIDKAGNLRTLTFNIKHK